MSRMKSTHYRRFLYVVLSALVCSSVGAASPPDNSITAVTSHPPGKSKADLFVKGGLSTCMKVNGQVILFDTGGESTPLLENLEKSGLDATLIEAIVFSHNEPDSVFGLADLLDPAAEKPKVFALPTAARAIMETNPDALVVAVSKPSLVLPDTWLVGPIQLENDGVTFYEQALVLDRPDGLIVIVGCSHPGIAEVVQQVKEVFGHRRIKLVAGGFHLHKTSKDEIREISLSLQQKGVKSLALSNCTGDPAMKIFRQEWGDRVVSFDRGQTIDLDR